MKKIAIIIMMILSTYALADDRPQPAPQPNLSPVAWSIGTWHCKGDYHQLPPFVDHAYSVEAQVTFRPTAGGFWLLGEYAELHTSDGTAPTSITEVFTTGPFGGARTFSDSHFGRFFGSFVASSTGVEFSGVYDLGGQQAPFTETLIRGPGDLSFTTDSQVFGVTFHTQVCVRE